MWKVRHFPPTRPGMIAECYPICNAAQGASQGGLGMVLHPPRTALRGSRPHELAPETIEAQAELEQCFTLKLPDSLLAQLEDA